MVCSSEYTYMGRIGQKKKKKRADLDQGSRGYTRHHPYNVSNGHIYLPGKFDIRHFYMLEACILDKLSKDI